MVTCLYTCLHDIATATEVTGVQEALCAARVLFGTKSS